MRKTTIALLVFLFTLIVLIFFNTFLTFKTSTEVYLDSSNILHYEGELSAEANKKLFELYESANKKPEILAITSLGGSIALGMNLGSWIYSNNLSISVNQHCFSSCANYIFTAAKVKYLGVDAALGWHGGASSTSFKWARRLSEPQKKEALNNLNVLKGSEEEYFYKIAINQKITTYGQLYHPEVKSAGYQGYNYSLDDMRKFGVTDIKLTDGRWNWLESNEKLNIKRIVVSSDKL